MDNPRLFAAEGSHEWFAMLRDDPDLGAAKELCERLAYAFDTYADAKFVWKCRTSEFPGRFWEMYCGGYFIHHALRLYTKSELRALRSINPDNCPDLCLAASPDIWIETTSISRGRNERLAEPSSGMVRDVPDQPMMTRILGGLRSKALKAVDYKEKGICRDDEPIVVAINCGQIPHVPDLDPPRIVRALYGIGMPVVSVDRATGHITDSRLGERKTIHKEQVPVASDVFLQDKPVEGIDYTHISAVLYSQATPFNAFPISRSWPEIRLRDALPLGADFVIVHNPYARCPLPRGAFRVPFEYLIDATGNVRCDLRH